MAEIQAGLRADIMRKQMETKQTIETEGDLYVGTGAGKTARLPKGDAGLPLRVLKSSETAPNSVGGLGYKAIDGDAISSEAITTAKIKDKTIQGTNIEIGILGNDQIANGAISGSFISPQTIMTQNFANDCTCSKGERLDSPQEEVVTSGQYLQKWANDNNLKAMILEIREPWDPTLYQYVGLGNCYQDNTNYTFNATITLPCIIGNTQDMEIYFYNININSSGLVTIKELYTEIKADKTITAENYEGLTGDALKNTKLHVITIFSNTSSTSGSGSGGNIKPGSGGSGGGHGPGGDDEIHIVPGH